MKKASFVFDGFKALFIAAFIMWLESFISALGSYGSMEGIGSGNYLEEGPMEMCMKGTE